MKRVYGICVGLLMVVNGCHSDPGAVEAQQVWDGGRNSCPFPAMATAYEFPQVVVLENRSNLCVDGTAHLTVTGTYALTQVWLNVCIGSTRGFCNARRNTTLEPRTYRYSTDCDDPRVTMERLVSGSDQRTESPWYAYPLGTRYAGHLGWSCRNFNFTVQDAQTGASVGRVHDDCTLVLDSPSTETGRVDASMGGDAASDRDASAGRFMDVRVTVTYPQRLPEFPEAALTNALTVRCAY